MATALKPQLGDWIRFGQVVDRWHHIGPSQQPAGHVSQTFRLAWTPKPSTAGRGLVCGIRVVQEGQVVPGYEDEQSYLAVDRRITVYVVATAMRRRHVYVRSEDITEIETGLK